MAWTVTDSVMLQRRGMAALLDWSQFSPTLSACHGQSQSFLKQNIKASNGATKTSNDKLLLTELWRFYRATRRNPAIKMSIVHARVDSLRH